MANHHHNKHNLNVQSAGPPLKQLDLPVDFQQGRGEGGHWAGDHDYDGDDHDGDYEDDGHYDGHNAD